MVGHRADRTDAHEPGEVVDDTREFAGDGGTEWRAIWFFFPLPPVSANQLRLQFITNDQAGQWRGSKLMGVDIYGPNDEKVGDVSDVLRVAG